MQEPSNENASVNETGDGNEKTKVVKKIERKVGTVLLALFFIIFIPLLRERYIAFNAVYHTRIADILPWAEATPFEAIPLIFVLVFVVLIYLLYLLTLLRQKKEAIDALPETDFRQLYKRIDMIGFVVYLTAVYIVINAFLFSVAAVEGPSMSPTINNGDNVIMRHTLVDYERFDIVVVKPDGPDDTYLIKRVIALPGEHIRIEAGSVYLMNGEDAQRLDESSFLPPATETDCSPADMYCDIELADNAYFLLGDNRNNSRDSRHFGPLGEEMIFGRVRYRLRPLSDFGRIE